ncbi:MAG: hypothetical protein ACJA1Z_003641 [Patiriisocius sp.]|jgi:hypothetical protein
MLDLTSMIDFGNIKYRDPCAFLSRRVFFLEINFERGVICFKAEIRKVFDKCPILMIVA